MYAPNDAVTDSNVLSFLVFLVAGPLLVSGRCSGKATALEESDSSDSVADTAAT